MRRAALLLVALLLAAAPSATAQDEIIDPSPLLAVGEPAANSTTNLTRPTIVVHIVDPEGLVDLATLALYVNGLIVSDDPDAFVLAEGVATYHPSVLFALRDGTQNVSAQVLAKTGELHRLNWSFEIDTTPASESFRIDPKAAAIIILAGVGGVGAAAVVVLFYLNKTRKFTLRKFFARHPVQRAYVVLYVPLFVAGVLTILGVVAVAEWPEAPRFATEYVVMLGIGLGLVAFALDAQAAQRRRGAYERAYAQFLFELADALRGGIDPVKSLVELAKTDTGVLGEHLRVAADSLRLGRPFELVMQNMARPMRSPLVYRYASLLGEAAKVGGEIASVVHRAAKDMEDLVRINRERARELKTPIVTMYIAFGVLLMMIASLMDFAPSLAQTDFGSLSVGETTKAPTVPRMELAVLEQRFFHLVVLTSLGTGLLIGSFTQGRLRNGLLHAFFMVGTATLFYRFVVLS